MFQNQKYREIKKRKLDFFIEKRLQGKRPKVRKQTSEVSEMENPQVQGKQEKKKSSSKEKSKSRAPHQSEDDEPIP